MYTMNKSCNCEVGRDPEVGNELDSLVQASVVNIVHARLKKQAMNESEAPSNRQVRSQSV